MSRVVFLDLDEVRALDNLTRQGDGDNDEPSLGELTAQAVTALVRQVEADNHGAYNIQQISTCWNPYGDRKPLGYLVVLA